jgi:exopolysaccharide biosynthesis protein
MKLKKIMIVFAVVILSICFSFNIYANDTGITVLRQHQTHEDITNGLILTTYRQITNAGYRSVNVLTADPVKVRLDALTSTVAVGMRQSLTNIVGGNNAIAGINADYFEMTSPYALSSGFSISQNGQTQVTAGVNRYNESLSALYVDVNNNPFIEYLSTSITFRNNGIQNINVAHMNKVSNFEAPVYFDIKAMADTGRIDEINNGLTKIVVKSGYITYISGKGELVTLPDDGYIIVMNSATADLHLWRFAVGQTAEFTYSVSLDNKSIQMALSGAAKMIENGEIVDGGFVVPGRTARSAIGITRDGKVLLVTCDNRNGSIGASAGEMAEIMLSLGAYQAMHLDGGGSTTMAVTDTRGSVRVQNRLSDGGQRAIINALGVIPGGSLGAIEYIRIETLSDNYISGVPFNARVIGYDGRGNRVPLEDVMLYTLEGGTVTQNGAVFEITSDITGDLALLGYYEGLFVEKKINLTPLGAFLPITPISIDWGTSVAINIPAVSAEGFTVVMPSGEWMNEAVSFEVVPESLGYVEDGRFYATAIGVGYIFCKMGDEFVYIDITVNIPTVSNVDTDDEEEQEDEHEFIILGGGIIDELIFGDMLDNETVLIYGDDEVDYIGFDGITFLSGGGLQTRQMLSLGYASMGMIGFEFHEPYDFTGFNRIGLTVRFNSPDNLLFAMFVDGMGERYDVQLVNKSRLIGFSDTYAELYDMESKLIGFYALNEDMDMAGRERIVLSNLTAVYSLSVISMPSPFLVEDVIILDDVEYEFAEEVDLTDRLEMRGFTDHRITYGLTEGHIIALNNESQFARYSWDTLDYSRLGNITSDIFLLMMTDNPHRKTNLVERDILMTVLREKQKAGINVYVVITSQTLSNSMVENGIRYIYLDNYSSFNLFKNGNVITYNIERK